MVCGPVSILWDIENCHVPSDVRPEDVAGNIRMALRMHPVITGAVAHFSAFGDFSGLRRQLREGCQRTGVKLVDVPNGRKDAADKAILVDMFVFALDNPPPSTILLISGDVDFAPALHILGQRGYTVILVIPAKVNVSSALTNAGSFVWDWPSVARGEGFVPPLKHPIPPVPNPADKQTSACPAFARKNVKGKGREEDIPVDIGICRNTSSSSGDFSDEKKIEMLENCGSSGKVDFYSHHLNSFSQEQKPKIELQTQKEQTFSPNPERSNLYRKTQNPNQTPISKNPETSPKNSNSQSQKYQKFTKKFKTSPKNPTPKSNRNHIKIKSLRKTPTPKSNRNPKKIKTSPKNPTPKSNPNPKEIETSPKNPTPKEIETSPKNPTPKSNPNPKEIETSPKNPTPKSNPNPKEIETLPKNPTPKSNPNPKKDKSITKKTQTPDQPITQKYQKFPETQKDHTFTKKTTKIPKTATKPPNLNVVKQMQHLERTSDTDPTLQNHGSNPLDPPQIPQSPRPPDEEAVEVGLDGADSGVLKTRRRWRGQRRPEDKEEKKKKG